MINQFQIEEIQSRPEADRLEDEQLAEGVEEDADGLSDADSEDENEDAPDPFQTHFVNPDESEISIKLRATSSDQWSTEKVQIPALGKCTFSQPAVDARKKAPSGKKLSSAKNLVLKKKLREPALRELPEFDQLNGELASYIFGYYDVLFGGRTVRNAQNLRQLYCLHALNHIFKTRDRVIKNNARAARAQESDEDIELRDQGFTRPKVLILLETRQACSRVIDTLISLSEPEQQENKKRFQDLFVDKEHKFSPDRPEDFRELFEGNSDNHFRLGLKFTRKTIKFFSKFYNSDIILASPLGLWLAIEAKGPKKLEYDFLSSIELVIIDQADAMLMQRWEHVTNILSYLNRQPREAHGCDFSRVRSWYLDGNAANLRQTLVFSAYLTPELNALATTQMRNIAGRAKIQTVYDGSILSLGGIRVKQTFSRFDSPSPAADPDARFNFFTSTMIPWIARHPRLRAEGGAGILVFVPSPLDFSRLRNYFASSAITQHVSFGCVTETNISEPEGQRARSHFANGRHAVLLYAGRAHHFWRPNIKGVKHVILYGIPENPEFYREVVGGFLGLAMREGRIGKEDGSVRTLFSKWEALSLERVVGSERVGGMVSGKGDVFDFV
ncbi:hypothetical protein BDY21DRAFT_368603 [Lineolata rhizophorae]|uniref:U3 small nucleolar RNA-associated protein 25 n=1 Tax=Lineolata rhizophorae TaxID=578093 RepID=A0A6A6PD68_9PEZI|nr:hypothetical protein BDY21DRAFT_368603 [Lineolata rhizophorae]